MRRPGPGHPVRVDEGDDESLHVLLAGGHLSGAQRERILDRVLSRRARGRLAGRAGLAAITSVVVGSLAVVLWLRLPDRTSASETPHVGPPAPRGSGGPFLSASCMGRPPGTCLTGDRLAFEVVDGAGGGFLAAYADCASQGLKESKERIWYFPDAAGEVPFGSGVPGQTVLDRVARVGDEHGEGDCTLHLFLLGQRADRAALASGAAAVKASVRIPINVSRQVGAAGQKRR
jgi:hypothetical protein